jgi:hypothetical protein
MRLRTGLRSVVGFAAVCAALLATVSIGGAAVAAGPPQPPPGLEKAIAAKERHADKLLEKPGVVGVGVGLNRANRAVVRIFTESTGVSGLPTSLDDVPVDVEVTGMFVARAPTDRFPRPVPIGVSTGHPAITAGTIGARVTDGTNVYALSNNHVYARSNDAAIGDPVIQPGTADGGKDPADRIGTLHDFQTIKFDGTDNVMDAAIAVSAPANLGTGTPVGGYGIPSSDTGAAVLGLPVQKYGRTTGYTQGTVSEIDVTSNVCYQLILFACVKQAKFVNQVAISPGSFSLGGDSGSLIVTQSGNHPLALLFAGSSTRTIGNPIDAVLNRFGVTVDGSPPGPPTVPAAPSGPSAVAGDGSVHVSWVAPGSDGGSPLSGYVVYRREGAGPLAAVATVGGTSFDDSGLSNGTTYFYRVAAVNGVGEGPQSGEVSATPQAASPPGAPTVLSVLAGDGAAHLAWAPPLSDGGAAVTGYRVYRGLSPGAGVPVATLGVVTGFDDAGLSNGVPYYYAVRALNSAGDGALSGEVSVTPATFVLVDDFNRPDENPLSDGARWSNGVNGSEKGLKVVSGQLAGSGSTTLTAWRNSAPYGPDAQVWARVTTLPGTGNAARLYARLQAPGSMAVDGYMLLYSQLSGTDQIAIYRIDNGALVSLAAFNREVAVGNRLLLRALGSTLEAWVNDGTSWARVGRVSDSTYAAAGYTGVGLRGTTGRLDDYGVRTP